MARKKIAVFGSRIARRVFLSFIFVSLVPLLATAFLVLFEVGTTLEDRARAEIQQVGRNTSQLLLDRLITADDMLSTLSSGLVGMQPVALEAAAIQTAAGLETLFGRFEELPRIDSENRDRSSLIVRSTQHGIEVLIASRIEKGVLVGRVSPEYLWWAANLLPSGMDLCVLVPGWQTPLFCSAPSPPPANATHGNAMEFGTSGEERGDTDGKVISSHSELFISSRFDGMPWSIVISQPKEVALESLAVFNRIFPLGIVVSLIVILLLATTQIKQTLRPLDRLVIGTKKIGQSRFSTRVKLSRDHEFGELGNAMNAMAEQLGKQFDTLTALAEVDRLTLSSQTIEEVLDCIVDRLSAVASCDVTVLLIDPDQQDRGRLYCKSIEAGKENEFIRIEVPHGLREWLAEQTEGQMSNLVAVRRRLPKLPNRLDLCPTFVVPILRGDDLQGALIASFPVDATVAESDLSSIREFASRFAVVISAAEREQQLFERAHFDVLTGLPNRQLCYDRLRQALAHARREEHKLALLFIDLDDFKHINDSLGHSNGDELLRETALRLRAALRDTDTVSRLGGDEYVVILPNVHGALEVEVIVGNVMDALKWPIVIDGRNSFISASIGVTLFPDDANSAEDLLRKADTAMYSAKDSGRGRYVFFAREMDDRVQERRALQTDLSSAMSNGELFLAYQPLLNLRGGQIVYAEALLRWKHPSRGLVPTELFLPILEETGLIESVGGWVLQTALRNFALWKKRRLPMDRIAVNVATRQLFDPGFVDLVDRCLRRAKLDGSSLELELTESTVIKDFDQTDSVLRELSSRGIRIAIDDFGTGYSSLGYLKDLTFDTVKIDRAFVSGLPEKRSLAIVKAVLGMAHSLGKQVVAEGIETEVQHTLLCELDCDIGQGFLLGRPQPGPDLVKWVDEAHATSLLDEAFSRNA